ncbi:carbamoyltransferase C-terminal domain-containing protein [Patulibacter sp. SYSU D01012]|uniref:carbamoyltransferase family protein n=1 Tax=Patulibacter sp. SYSU D01012 TaxID=2817381 RepID=UPI001B3033F4|nr:carbamoyltransferase C-terminal domain-containing protein [Patulibacter sp. SYSU D01012]
MIVLGVNAVFHDPAAAIVVDGRIVAAAEEERFSRRKHGKPSVPFSTWELPEQAIRFCLREAGVRPEDLDAVAYSYDPALAPATDDVIQDEWEGLRTLYVQRAGLFLRTVMPGFDPEKVRFVPHHVAHAASAYLACGEDDCATMVVDGRGERGSYLAGKVTDGRLQPLADQALPHSLGLLYEGLTEHLGFHRGSDEYKVMALASYGRPRFADALAEHVHVTPDGGFRAAGVDFERFAPRIPAGQEVRPDSQAHADLASSVQRRVEDVLIELATGLHEQTGARTLAMAGGVALNCVANSRLHRETPFERIWVQPAAGDSGTALGAALYVARELGDRPGPFTTPDLGCGFDDAELEASLQRAGLPYERPDDLAGAVADILADNGVIAWFQGRSEFGPRALGHRSLLADPRHTDNLERMNDIKGREQFRPVAPMVLADRAAEIFSGGPLPSPYMLFTHDVAPEWRDRIPTVVHVDGSARAQTVDERDEPLMAAVLREFDARTGVPVLVNTSLNTSGRPMVDDPQDAMELFGSAPVQALVIGPFVVRRAALAAGRPPLALADEEAA